MSHTEKSIRAAIRHLGEYVKTKNPDDVRDLRIILDTCVEMRIKDNKLDIDYTPEEVVEIKRKLEARTEHLMDLYDVLGVQWNGDPFTRIQYLLRMEQAVLKAEKEKNFVNSLNTSADKPTERNPKCIACKDGAVFMNTDPLYPGYKPGDPSPPEDCRRHNAKGHHHILWNGTENETVECGSERCNNLALYNTPEPDHDSRLKSNQRMHRPQSGLGGGVGIE